MREAVTRGYGDGGDVGGVFDFGPYLVKKISSVLVLCKGGGAWPRWEEGNFKKSVNKVSYRGAQTDTRRQFRQFQLSAWHSQTTLCI